MLKINVILLFVAATLTSSFSFAGIEIPCVRTEYARLKDATKKELESEYREAMGKATLNASLRDASLSDKEFSDRGNAQVSCLRAADDAAVMLKKKFKAGPPK